MKHPLLILLVINLLVAQQDEVIKPTNLEIDQIKYNEQKLTLIRAYKFDSIEIFNSRILK